ncbi:ABC transporter ATP-binding protein [Thalassotalea fusca]
MLVAQNLIKNYGAKPVIEKLNVSFKRRHYCISGVNGCGKTTLLTILAGIEPATAGKVTLNNASIHTTITRKKIGISSDRIVLPELLTAEQLIRFHCQQHHCAYPTEIINALFFDIQLPNLVNALSLGSLKKLSLILALAHRPECLLLDEPTTGLDSSSREWLLTHITNYHGIVIVTSHEADFIDNPLYLQLPFAQLQGQGEKKGEGTGEKVQ